MPRRKSRGSPFGSVQYPAVTEEWQAVLERISDAVPDGWAVTGSSALVLHGMPVEPGDLDLVATDDAATRIAAALNGLVKSDDQPYERGPVQAVRRLALSVGSVPVEVLVNVTTHGPEADVPSFEVCDADEVGRHRVVRLRALAAINEAMGRRVEADAIAAWMRR
jgi:hypothetical protein